MITPKNWNTFQHYKTRKPPWIKLHSGLLDNYEFCRLPVASKALAPSLWLLASEFEGGRITITLDAIAFRMRMPVDDLVDALKPLIDADFFAADSTMLAPRKRHATPETETETEREAEKNIGQNENRDDWPPGYREFFWHDYPRKVGKIGALKALDAVRKHRLVSFQLIAAVRAYAATTDPQFTKHPQTWLNKGCWDDEPDKRLPNGKTSVLDAADRLVERINQFNEPAPEDEPRRLRVTEGAVAVRTIPKGRRE